jgi:hypothetical protein
VTDQETIHDMKVMNQQFILFRRAGVYYCEDTTTGKQLSLRTKDEGEAKTLLNAKNESFRQPILNLQIARTYMAASDPQVSKRTWQSPMDEMTRTKTGSTRIRHERAMMDSAFDTIRNLPIVETNSTHFLGLLHEDDSSWLAAGGVQNHFRRAALLFLRGDVEPTPGEIAVSCGEAAARKLLVSSQEKNHTLAYFGVGHLDLLRLDVSWTTRLPLQP